MSSKTFACVFFATLCFASLAQAETHYEARNCEIFVDEMHLVYGSHASKTVVLNVKTLNHRLDGRIVEVGFRYGVGANWKNEILRPVSHDYFSFNVAIGGGDGMGFNWIQGAFYVRTDRGTYYWLHPWHQNGNFVIGQSTYDALMREGHYGRTPSTRSGELQQFNPDQCY